MVDYEEGTGAALAKFADVCVIILTAAAVVAVIVGALVLVRLGPLAEGVEELNARAEADAGALAKTGAFAEAAAPDYNLAVGYYDAVSKKDVPLTDSKGVRAGKAADVEFRVYNVTPPAETTPPPKKEAAEEGEDEEPADKEPAPAPEAAPALRRAEGVSVTVMFPTGVEVSTASAAGATVQKFPRPAGTLVTVDWGAGKPLHPDTYFAFRARVKPDKKGKYDLQVVADANGAYATGPAFVGKLRFVVD